MTPLETRIDQIGKNIRRLWQNGSKRVASISMNRMRSSPALNQKLKKRWRALKREKPDPVRLPLRFEIILAACRPGVNFLWLSGPRLGSAPDVAAFGVRRHDVQC